MTREEFLAEERRLDNKEENKWLKRESLRRNEESSRRSNDIVNNCTRSIREYLALTSIAIIGFLMTESYDIHDIAFSLSLILLVIANLSSFFVLFFYRAVNRLDFGEDTKKQDRLARYGSITINLSITSHSLAVLIIVTSVLLKIWCS
ncbi:MAG: hypothetical protein K0U41_06480 [Gammaproteobacteria bacterium]|nr:hypothetical protein [Gammaproteobacteria bacterium]